MSTFPFDRTRSHLLDAVCWLLDHRPPLFVRIALRLYKRRLESGVTR
jgi:hypothetical protein